MSLLDEPPGDDPELPDEPALPAPHSHCLFRRGAVPMTLGVWPGMPSTSHQSERLQRVERRPAEGAQIQS